MENLHLVSVKSARDRRTFLTMPWRIYGDDPMWVPPLLPERERAISPESGVFFRRGEAEFFTALRNGKPVGTICAARDDVQNRWTGRAEAIFGFFECIDDESVADALINHAKQWAVQRGLSRISGPFNLDYENDYGVLIDGWDRPPAMLCTHSPRYYQRIFETRGFTALRGDNIAYGLVIDPDSAPFRKVSRLAEHIRKQGRVAIRTPDMERWDDEVEIVQRLLNRSTSHLADYRPWERDALAELLEPFRKFADPELILFAEVAGNSVGWFPAVPDMNEILIHLNGLRYPWDRLRALPFRHFRPKNLTIKSVLLLPEFWRTGVAVLMIHEMATRAHERGYRWVDLSLTSDDNPNTPQLAERMGACIYKRYRVYTQNLLR